jgi:hypothetical protein
VPLAASLALVQRYTQRQLLYRARGRGQHLQTTLLVGHRNTVAVVHQQTDREADHGYRVIGCCLRPVSSTPLRMHSTVCPLSAGSTRWPTSWQSCPAPNSTGWRCVPRNVTPIALLPTSDSLFWLFYRRVRRLLE